MAEETQKVAEEAKVEAPVQEAPKAEAPAKKTSLNASVAPDKFDWDAFEGGSEIYGGEDKKSIEDAYDQTLSKIVENEVVEGRILSIHFFLPLCCKNKEREPDFGTRHCF